MFYFYIMQKSQVIVLAAALALCGLLYSFPKVLVSAKDKLPANRTTTQASDTQANASAAHTSAITPDQAVFINRLRAGYVRSVDNEKKIKFADSLASAFRQFSQYDSAAHYVEVVVESQPTAAGWLRAGDAYYDALNFATDGQQASVMGDKARFYYQKVLEKQPEQLDVKARMAMTYASTDNPMQGVTMLREVLAQDPDNRTAMLNMGLLSIRSGQYDKAIGRFEQLLQKDPTNEQAQFYLGITYAEAGQPEKARQLLQQIKEKTSDPVMRSTADEYLKNLK